MTLDLSGRRGPALLLLVLVLVIYGANLGDGPLSDDELYLERSGRGALVLLRAVTVDSAPQMIRPWPALFWLWPAGLAKLPLLHLISLLLHAGVATLVARLALRRAGEAAAGNEGAELRAGGLWLGALFSALPLTTEGILWLSASFDLWAAFWALLAFQLALDAGEVPARSSRGREALAVAAFGLALISKESILAAPLLAVLLFGRRIRWPVIATWTGMVAASLLLRLALFGSLGGYAGAGGGPMPPKPWLLLRNLFVQTPFRLLQPWREWAALPAGAGAFLLAGSMIVCLGLAAWALGLDRRRAVLWQTPAALLISALPLAAVFGLDAHHGNGRLLYFPAAVTAVALGGALAPRGRALRFAWPLLAVFALAAFANAQAYRRAAEGKVELLAQLAASESRWPPRVLIQVDAPDTVMGVPVWRSAEGAFERALLRRDLSFAVGHPGLLLNPQGLGERIFVVGPGDHGRLVDWTRCEQELRRPLELSGAAAGNPAVAEVAMPAQPPRGFARLYLWPPGGRPVTGSAVLFLPPAANEKLRLRLPLGIRAPLELRVDAESGGPLTAAVLLREAPEPCREPHVIDSGPSPPEE